MYFLSEIRKCFSSLVFSLFWLAKLKVLLWNTSVYVLESTWFHSFEINDMTQDPSVFDLDSYPRTLEFEELVTGNLVYLDIAYISISTVSRNVNAVTHQTSLHFIEGEGWRYYDGMNIVNTLSDVPANLHLNNRVTSINYFRRIVRRDP